MTTKSKRMSREIGKGKSVKVETSYYNRLREIAEKDHRSISAQIAFLVDFYLASERLMASKP